MVDMPAIASLMTSIKAVTDIARAMKDVRDANLIQTKVFELTREILDVQRYALEANALQFAQSQRIHELETKIAEFEEWNKQKDRYRLVKFTNGMIAYVLKEGTENGEPEHAICPNCYEDGKVSILQRERRDPGRRVFYVCHRCKLALQSMLADLS